jgi:hypothetical protein
MNARVVQQKGNTEYQLLTDNPVHGVTDLSSFSFFLMNDNVLSAVT